MMMMVMVMMMTMMMMVMMTMTMVVVVMMNTMYDCSTELHLPTDAPLPPPTTTPGGWES